MPADAVVNLKVVENMAPGLTKASGQLKAFGRNLSSVGKRMSLFVTGPLAAMGAISLKNAAQFEKQQVAFETLLGDAQQAQTLLKDIENFAATTPFQMPGLIDGSQRLLAFGIAAEDVVGTMRRMGDLAMGDEEKLNRLVDAFGKVASRGKATMRELNMFIYSGVPIVQALADRFGVTTEKLFEMSQQGKVTFEEVQAAVKAMTDEGGQFYGMTEKQSETLAGLFSTLKDNIGMLGREIMTVIMPALKNFIDNAIGFIQKLRTMDEDTKKLILKIVAIAAAIGPVILAIGALATALGVIISPIGLVIAAIGALGVAAFLIAKNWEDVSGFLKDLWLDIRDFALKIFQHIKIAVLTPIREVLEFVLNLASKVKAVFKRIDVGGLENALAKINGNLEESGLQLEDLQNKTPRTADEFQGFGQNIKDLAVKVKNLAVQMAGFVINGFNMGDVVGDIADQMDQMADAMNRADESVKNLNEDLLWQMQLQENLAEFTAITRDETINYKSSVDVALETMEAHKKHMQDMSTKILPSWSQAWQIMGDSTMSATEKMGEALKAVFGNVLEMIGQEHFALGLEALIPFPPWKFNPASAAMHFALSAAAYTAAGYIRSLAQGGEFTTSGPEMIMVGDNPSGRERVRVEPLGGGEGSGDMLHAQFVLDGRVMGEWIAKAVRTKQIPIYKGSVVNR